MTETELHSYSAKAVGVVSKPVVKHKLSCTYPLYVPLSNYSYENIRSKTLIFRFITNIRFWPNIRFFAEYSAILPNI